MTHTRENAVVGVLVGLARLLMRGIGPALRLARRASEVHITMRVNGLSEGSQSIDVGVGRVTAIRRDEQSFEVDTAIDNHLPLPANVAGLIRTPSLVSGGGVLSTEVPDGTPPVGTLADGHRVPARFAGSQLIPPEFGAVASQLRDSHVVAYLDQSGRQWSEVLKALRAYVDDPVKRVTLQGSIKNTRQITETTRQSRAESFGFGTLSRYAGRGLG